MADNLDEISNSTGNKEETESAFRKAGQVFISAIGKEKEGKEKSKSQKKKNAHAHKRESKVEEDISDEILNRLANDANKYLLLKVLSPQVRKNEDKKRKHKTALMVMTGLFLGGQFALVAIIICYGGNKIIEYQATERPFSNETIKLIFTFVGAYITSIVVELIAILKYIVEKVFDTSISDLMKLFKTENNVEEKDKLEDVA